MAKMQDVHPNQIADGRNQSLKGADDVFGAETAEPTIDPKDLHVKIEVQTRRIAISSNQRLALISVRLNRAMLRCVLIGDRLPRAGVSTLDHVRGIDLAQREHPRVFDEGFGERRRERTRGRQYGEVYAYLRPEGPKDEVGTSVLAGGDWIDQRDAEACGNHRALSGRGLDLHLVSSADAVRGEQRVNERARVKGARRSDEGLAFQVC